MISVLGTSLGVFIGVTVILLGFAAYMTGQALAITWRPAWQVVIYGFLLGLASRFLIFSLYDGVLLSFTGYVIDVATLLAIALVSFRYARVSKMVSQYPWLYERSGPFSWREKKA